MNGPESYSPDVEATSLIDAESRASLQLARHEIINRTDLGLGEHGETAHYDEVLQAIPEKVDARCIDLPPKWERVFQEVCEKYAESLRSLGEHDAGTLYHSLRVARNAMALRWYSGRESAHDPQLEEDMRALALAGIMHDMGKITVPAEVINAPRKLDRHEAKVMGEHPAHSSRYAEQVVQDEPEGVKQNAVLLSLLHHRIQKVPSPNIAADPSEELSPELRGHFEELHQMMEVADKFDSMFNPRNYNREEMEGTTIEEIEEKIANDFTGAQLSDHYPEWIQGLYEAWTQERRQ